MWQYEKSTDIRIIQWTSSVQCLHTIFKTIHAVGFELFHSKERLTLLVIMEPTDEDMNCKTCIVCVFGCDLLC